MTCKVCLWLGKLGRADAASFFFQNEQVPLHTHFPSSCGHPGAVTEVSSCSPASKHRLLVRAHTTGLSKGKAKQTRTSVPGLLLHGELEGRRVYRLHAEGQPAKKIRKTAELFQSFTHVLRYTTENTYGKQKSNGTRKKTACLTGLQENKRLFRLGVTARRR